MIAVQSFIDFPRESVGFADQLHGACHLTAAMPQWGCALSVGSREDRGHD
jgi:hypothetical protein